MHQIASKFDLLSIYDAFEVLRLTKIDKIDED